MELKGKRGGGGPNKDEKVEKCEASGEGLCARERPIRGEPDWLEGDPPVYRYSDEIEDRARATGHVHRDVEVADEDRQAPSTVHLEGKKNNKIKKFE